MLDLAYIGLIFFTALLLSLILVPISSRVAFYLGLIDLPNKRKVHSKPVPRSGGLAIAISLFLSILMWLRLTTIVKGFLAGAAIVVFVGMIDDKFSLPPKLKFIGEILAAMVFMTITHIHLISLGNILGVGELKLSFLSPGITVIGMVGVMNALNMADGLDGLAGGITAIASLFLFIFAYQHHDWALASIIIILMGTVLGFLRYNTHPAQIFMGDTGSLLLGYSLAAIAVAIVRPINGLPKVHPVSMAIILALPIVDTLYVMGSRLLKGQGIFYPDKNHLHHRLMKIGLSHSSAVGTIYMLMGFFGILSLLVQKWPEHYQFFLSLFIIILIYYLLGLLDKGKINIFEKLNIKRNINSQIKTSLITWSGKSVKVATPLFLFFLFFPLLILPSPSKIYGSFALGLFFLLLTFFPWKGKRDRMPIIHAILYISCFSILIIYYFAYNIEWVKIYLLLMSLLAFIWTVFIVIFKGRAQILLPSSFEILLILFSWLIPFGVSSIFNLSPEIKQKIILICFESCPLMAAIKVLLGRDTPRRTWLFVISFLGGFFTVLLKSFW